MAGYTRAQRVASFLSRVKYGESDECWHWDGATYNCGYGVFKWDKNRAASRVMWEIANGQEIPEGMDVCHTCDNRLCVNPTHLWIGTHRDNMLDKMRKGRDPLLKLKPDQVREVRRLLPTMKQSDIADMFKVSRGVINDIAAGRTYRHVA